MQITINNEVFKLISYTCTFSFVETGDIVQTLDGVDHIEKGKLKRVINATTSDLYPEQNSALMQILKERIVSVLYDDTPTNTEQTRVFIVKGDLKSSKKLWKSGIMFYSGMSLEFREKGAE